MFEKIKEKGNHIGLVVGITVMALPSLAFADATTPTSMLDAGVTDILGDFAADIVPTVLALIGMLVPVGLTLWALGFGIKKGLSFIQRRAGSSI